MTKALLLSNDFTDESNNELQRLLNKQPQDVRILFSSNAADSLKDGNRELRFIQQAKQELNQFGYNFESLDLMEYVDKSTDLVDLLKKYDAVFFTGGFYFDLLNQFYLTGLTEIYPQLLNEGLVHIGFSAAAMIFSKEMKYYQPISSDKYKGVRHPKGLGIFPHYIIPHYSDNPKFTEKFQKVTKIFREENIKFIPLTNNQAIVLEGDDWKII